MSSGISTFHLLPHQNHSLCGGPYIQNSLQKYPTDLIEMMNDVVMRMLKYHVVYSAQHLDRAYILPNWSVGNALTCPFSSFGIPIIEAFTKLKVDCVPSIEL